MRQNNTSSTTAKYSNRSATIEKKTLRDYIVGAGILTFFLIIMSADAIGHFYTFVGIVAAAALIYLGKGFRFQNKSNR